MPGDLWPERLIEGTIRRLHRMPTIAEIVEVVCRRAEWKDVDRETWEALARTAIMYLRDPEVVLPKEPCSPAEQWEEIKISEVIDGLSVMVNAELQSLPPWPQRVPPRANKSATEYSRHVIAREAYRRAIPPLIGPTLRASALFALRRYYGWLSDAEVDPFIPWESNIFLREAQEVRRGLLSLGRRSKPPPGYDLPGVERGRLILTWRAAPNALIFDLGGTEAARNVRQYQESLVAQMNEWRLRWPKLASMADRMKGGVTGVSTGLKLLRITGKNCTLGVSLRRVVL